MTTNTWNPFNALIKELLQAMFISDFSWFLFLFLSNVYFYEILISIKILKKKKQDQKGEYINHEVPMKPLPCINQSNTNLS